MVLHHSNLTVITRVTQGSVHGPLLFIINMSIPCVISLSNCSELIMYADDLVLYKHNYFKRGGLDKFTNFANKSWVEEKHLTFNTKCKCMLLTHRSSTMPDLFFFNEPVTIATKYPDVLYSNF